MNGWRVRERIGRERVEECLGYDGAREGKVRKD